MNWCTWGLSSLTKIPGKSMLPQWLIPPWTVAIWIPETRKYKIICETLVKTPSIACPPPYPLSSSNWNVHAAFHYFCPIFIRAVYTCQDHRIIETTACPGWVLKLEISFILPNQFWILQWMKGKISLIFWWRNKPLLVENTGLIIIS